MKKEYYNLGLESYRDLDDYEQASKYFEKAVEEEPNNVLAKMYLSLSRAAGSEEYDGEKTRGYIEKNLKLYGEKIEDDEFHNFLYDYHIYNSRVIDEWVSDRITYRSIELFSLALDILIDCTQNQLWIYTTYISRIDLDTKPEEDLYRINILKGLSKMYYKFCLTYSYVSYNGERTYKSLPNKKNYAKLLSENDQQILELDPKYKPLKSSGCYVATCVYGAYDCPEVWTLRRYRDNTLSKTAFGRAFIRIYYAISPKLIERFGNKKIFKNFFKKILDDMVGKLQAAGVESTPYCDR